MTEPRAQAYTDKNGTRSSQVKWTASCLTTLKLTKLTHFLHKFTSWMTARQAENGRKIGLTYEKVFPNSFDNYINTRKVDYRLHKHLKNANCIDLGFHAFRHTHASILLNAGLPYKEIQTRLGHAKISVTMDTYSHLSKENQKRAVSVFETALEKIKSS